MLLLVTLLLMLLCVSASLWSYIDVAGSWQAVPCNKNAAVLH